MVPDDDEGEHPTQPREETHVLPLRGGRIELVGEPGSIPVDMTRRHIGRSLRCELVLNDPTVSSVHAEVQATPRGVRLVDLNSRNGTFIDEASVVEVYLTGRCDFFCGDKHLCFVPEPVQKVEIKAPTRFGGLLGTTPEMIELFAKLQRFAPTTMPILIQGETGTGKEWLARAIHEASPRRHMPLLGINCAALSDNLLEAELFGHVKGAFTGADRANAGLFVEADGGTLLFDEVGEMSAAMQAKLLRVLENHEVRPVGAARSRTVNVRTLFATNVDLRRAVNEKRFREDLYFRLAQVTVEIPPLRKRMDDVPLLMDDILAQLARPHMELDEAAMAAVRSYHWPGNVRQLRTVIEHALVESDGNRLMIERALDGTSTSANPERPSGPYDDARREFDRRYYTPLHVLFNGNISQIAKAANKHRATVTDALKELGLYVAEPKRKGT
jgi:DNA-binding NtrC family response regulator